MWTSCFRADYQRSSTLMMLRRLAVRLGFLSTPIRLPLPLPALGVDFENSNGYLVEVVNETDTNIFLQTTDTAVGKDKAEPVC